MAMLLPASAVGAHDRYGSSGIGTGAFMSLIVAVVQGAVPASQTGTITAAINLVRQVGSTVATAVIGG